MFQIDWNNQNLDVREILWWSTGDNDSYQRKNERILGKNWILPSTGVTSFFNNITVKKVYHNLKISSLIYNDNDIDLLDGEFT